MFNPDLDFFLSRIPDPTTTKKEREKLWFIFFCSHKFHKKGQKIILFLNRYVANCQRIKVFFTQKIATKLSSEMVLGSGIRKKPIPDQGAKRHQIRNTGYEEPICNFFYKIWGQKFYARQGFGLGSAWIHISLSCWIRIRSRRAKMTHNYKK
jgi:hypothetical protein